MRPALRQILLTPSLEQQIRNLFRAGEQGAWYDPSDLSSMYQGSTGVTPAAINSPVGLILDKRLGMVRGDNLFTNAQNGTFATGIDGIALTYGGATISHYAVVPSIKVVSGGGAPTGVAMQAFTSVVGRHYEITATLMAPSANVAANAASLTTNPSGGTVAEGVQASAEDTWQTKSFIFQATDVTTIVYGWVLNRDVAWGTAGDEAYFTNISVREIPGNHASQATAASRPTLKQDANGKLYLEFDGIDDSLATSAIDFTATDKMTAVVGAAIAAAGTGIVVELSTSILTNTGSFAVITSNSATGAYSLARRGSGGSAAASTSSAYSLGTPVVLSGGLDLSGATAATESPTFRINTASLAAGGGDTGSGNFGNYALYIGRRGGASIPFNGRIYSLTVLGRAASAREIASLERWTNQKTGAY